MAGLGLTGPAASADGDETLPAVGDAHEVVAVVLSVDRPFRGDLPGDPVPGDEAASAVSDADIDALVLGGQEQDEQQESQHEESSDQE